MSDTFPYSTNLCWSGFVTLVWSFVDLFSLFSVAHKIKSMIDAKGINLESPSLLRKTPFLACRGSVTKPSATLVDMCTVQ